MEKYKLCRACMQSEEVKLNMEKFLEFQYQDDSLKKFTTLTSISMDKLKICQNCHKEMLAAYEFREKCLATEKTIRANFKFKQIVTDPNKPKKHHCCYCNKSFTEKYDLTRHCRSKSHKKLTVKVSQVDVKEKLSSTKTEFINTESIDIKDMSCTEEIEIFNQKIDKNNYTDDSNDDINGDDDISISLLADLKFLNSKSPNMSEKLPSLNANNNRETEDSDSDSDDDKLSNDNKYNCEEIEIDKTSVEPKRKRGKKKSNVTHECTKCNKIFDRYYPFKKHMKIHNKTIKCETCDKLFPNITQLKRHMWVHKDKKPHVCVVCTRGFPLPSILKDHMRIHTNDKPFLCSECGSTFNNASTLRDHILRHKGVKPFCCNECPARFVNNYTLKCHLITHTGEKKYECKLCNKTFTAANTLKKHIRIHTGERPYKCSTCPMTFISSGRLSKHTRIHNGIKPFACSFCGRRFVQSNDLTKHLRTHVGEHVYQCNACDASFKMHAQLKKHLQEHFKTEREKDKNYKVKESEAFNLLSGHLFLKNKATFKQTTTTVPNVDEIIYRQPVEESQSMKMI